MKTLIINGSPRKLGDSMTLVNEMIKHLSGEVKIVDTYYDDISPCIDCRFCWKNDECLIDDDMQAVYKLLDEVDNVIISSPIYFSELTGKLLSFASRLQRFYVSRCIKKNKNFKLKEKSGVLVLTGGGDGSIEPAVNRANIIFRQINAQPIGRVVSLKTNDIPTYDDVNALNRAKELSFCLNELNRNNSSS